LTPQARDLVKLRAGKLGISHSEYIERVILEAEKWESLRELVLRPNSARGGYPQIGMTFGPMTSARNFVQKCDLMR
jgi:hypothetical protein